MENRQRVEPKSDAILNLTTLGGAEAVCARGDDAPATVLGPGKPLALIAYLALSPRRTASREHLLGLLWADSDPERAHHALRQTAWQIQHAVGARVLVAHNGEISLAVPVETDCARFLAAVEAGDHERAVALYTGDFLPDFAAPGGAGFEQWAEIERARLRAAFLRSVESLARQHLAQGHVRQAQRLARRGRDTDRLNEAGWRLLLETLVAGSDWTAAAMEAEALERLLMTEETEPEPATRAAILRARQTPPDSRHAPPRTLVAELVGREKEFAAIVEAWDAARRGNARHVHVTAAAGLGKTRLLHDALARLRAGGARAVYVRANPGEHGIPYTLAAEIAAALASLPGAAGVSPGAAAALVALNPSLSALYAVSPHALRGDDAMRSRIVAVAELLAAVTDEGPVALLLDDLHWADGDSRQVVSALAARLETHRALLVTATRPVPLRVFEGPAPIPLQLEPLTEKLVGALTTSIAALPDEPWAREFPSRLAQAARGSPLLVLESLQLALERGTLALAHDMWTCPHQAELAGMLSAGSALQRRLDQQDRESRWVMICLASAGIPLSASVLARAAGRSEDAAERTLQTLEERGLVARSGSTWEPGHDELASLVLGSATPDALRAAQERVGRALATDWAREPALARHAAALLAAAGDDGALSGLFRQWIATAHRRGDRRAAAVMARELLGDQGSEARVRAMTRALPARVRLGIDTPRRQAAAVAATLTVGLAAAVALTRHQPPSADAVIVALGGGPRGGVAWRGAVRRDSWDPRSDVPLERAPLTGSLVAAGLRSPAPMAPAPTGGSWIAEHVFPDTGALDLVQLFDDGRPARRLTFTRGDDGAPSWAPDGSAIVFTTARWNALSHFDLGVLDLASGAVRQLTSGDDADSYPSWSPDGSRIAFGRRRFDGRPPEACVITVDGADLRCYVVAASRAPIVLGWRDPDEVVMEWDSSGVTVRDILRTQSGERRSLRGPAGGQAILSPDGAWVLWRGADAPANPDRWYVFPLDRPETLRPVGGERADSLRMIWATTGTPRAYLAHLRIALPTGPIPVLAGHVMSVTGRDAARHIVPARMLRWRSDDTSVAAVRESGLLVPRRAGRVTIHVTAGGWRTDSLQVEIGPATSQTVLHESWGDGLAARWVPFGDPLPTIVRLPDASWALWSRGDSSYDSGVYSRQVFGATDGLGFEVAVSGRITAQQWQRHFISLDGSLDSAWLASWDHRTGGLEGSLGPARAQCEAWFPSQEGASGANDVAFGCRPEVVEVPAPPGLGDGVRHVIRLQLLPDGRLGLAINGRPVGLTATRAPLALPFRIVLSGQSRGTRLLMGEVTAWTGVRDDIDWRTIERAPGR
jgi:DNA-binding SARP family transcriptional activator